MKRKLLSVAAILLLTFVLAGCKNAADDSETAATKETTTEEAVGEAAASDTAKDGEDTADTNITPTVAPTKAPEQTAEAESADQAPVTYKDGVYEVQTEPDYENYYTKATVTIEGGAIKSVDWCIYDVTLKDKPFDEEYYHVYENVNDVYVQQAKDDWSGSRGYDDVLIECQDIDEVDAVSGATWTNKKFKEIVTMALDQAKN